jgi:hypothetical protein
LGVLLRVRNASPESSPMSRCYLFSLASSQEWYISRKRIFCKAVRMTALTTITVDVWMTDGVVMPTLVLHIIPENCISMIWSRELAPYEVTVNNRYRMMDKEHKSNFDL